MKYLITKHDNRNYYVVGGGEIINLKEMDEMLSQGDEVVVIDHKTKADITAEVLRRILFRRERKSPNCDTCMLRRIISSPSGTITGYIKELEKNL